MKLLIVQITDLHIKNKDDEFDVDVSKLVQALKLVGDIDKVMLVAVGDIAFSGKREEYRCAGGLLIAICKKIREEFGAQVEVCVVPGNHDINFDDLEQNFEILENSYRRKNVIQKSDEYIGHMSDYMFFSAKHRCFEKDKIIDKKVIKLGEKAVGFIMINTAPLSLLGGANGDKGFHYLSKENIRKIDRLAVDDVNVLVMHHNYEWFSQDIKNELRDIISRKYQMVLTGHEHYNIAENMKINDKLNVFCSQGYALHGAIEELGYSAFVINLDNNEMRPYSYLLKNGIYMQSIHEAISFPNKVAGKFVVNPKKLRELLCDSDGVKYESYFVFPEMVYEDQNTEDEIKKYACNDFESLLKIVSEKTSIIVSGGKKAGKTTLSRMLFDKLINNNYVPVLIAASDIDKKRISNVVKNMFEEQYIMEDETFDIFLQTEKTQKIAIIDEYDKLKENTAQELLGLLNELFGHVIIFSEEQVSVDVKRKVYDALLFKELPVQVSIKPFLYTKRRELIARILTNTGKYNKKEVEKINELINTQIKFFDLSPEFIINFINQYVNQYRFQFSSGINAFSVVYENSLKGKVIQHSEKIDPNVALQLLSNLAFYMHFRKKNVVELQEISEVIKQYNTDYRQKVKEIDFISAIIEAKILYEADNSYRFRDAATEAYFVARSINQKWSSGIDIRNEVNYMLDNLCFGINSDVVLFLSLINNDPRYLDIIIEGAKKHFEGMDEINFESGNIKRLTSSPISVKDNIPTKEEKEKRDMLRNIQEEETRESIVKLVDEYDYTEEDLLKIENQLLISFKYLEILCKTLPAFCYNLKVDVQDELASMIYKCPNMFLYSVLKDLNDDFEDISNELCEEINTNRGEGTVNVDIVRKMLEKMSLGLIYGVYNLVASTCSTEQSIEALNAFPYDINTNYKLMNLMMRKQCEGLSNFSKAAFELDDKNLDPVVRSFVKFTVREYFLKNDIYMKGEAQSLMDHFFKDSGNRKLIKTEMAKNKLKTERALKEKE